MTRCKNSKAEDGDSSFWSTLPGVLTGIATVIGAITTLTLGLKEVGLIGQRKDIPAPAASSDSIWTFVGFASTGEGVYVNSQNIQKSEQNTSFIYKIGKDLVSASTDCSANRWQVSGSSEMYYPQSEATETMLKYVCEFP